MPHLEAARPWLYLKGVSSGQMDEALSVLAGPQAKGLSASTVSRLKRSWSEQDQQWRTRALDKDRWEYIWADGVKFKDGIEVTTDDQCAA